MSFVLTCTIRQGIHPEIHVRDFASEEEIHLPLSQVESILFNKDGTARIEMSDWIARMKGFL